MTNGYDSYHARFIIDLVAYSPVAYAYAPQSFFSFHFQASVGTWIVSQSKSRRRDTVLRRTIEPL